MATTRATLAGKHVLVVEDEFLVAIDIEAELHDNGARVTCAATLASAEACAKNEHFDAAILDVNLHGKAFVSGRRLPAPGARSLPVPYGTRREAHAHRALSGVEVCNKPCDGTALVSMLGRVLSTARSA